MIEKRIEDYIPVGKANAVNRRELSSYTGFPDRQVRAAIAESVQHGTVILNHQDGAGYFRPNKPDQASAEDILYVMREYAQEKARMMATKKRLKTLHAWLAAAGALKPKKQ